MDDKKEAIKRSEELEKERVPTREDLEKEDKEFMKDAEKAKSFLDKMDEME